MTIRQAIPQDVSSIVALLADDALGKKREDFKVPIPDCYVNAFNAILKDENQELMVVETNSGDIIGTFQLSFIQYLTYKGGIRAQIEAVRIKKEYRGQGLGKTMFLWAIDRAKTRKAHLLQLTSDKLRPDAIRFYEQLGFKASHEGFKMHFDASPDTSGK